MEGGHVGDSSYKMLKPMGAAGAANTQGQRKSGQPRVISLTDLCQLSKGQPKREGTLSEEPDGL